MARRQDKNLIRFLTQYSAYAIIQIMQKDKNIPQKILTRLGGSTREDEKPENVRRRGLGRAVGAVAVTSALLISGHQLTEKPKEGPKITYTVGPGDTLWGIAGRIDPDHSEDIRKIVDNLENTVHTADDRAYTGELQPGDTVQVDVNSPLGHELQQRQEQLAQEQNAG